jgi:hypothetical protein
MTSSWIESVSHDGVDTATMTLKNGESYEILDIESSTVNDWKDADSLGGYHNSEIRENFDAVKR